MACVIAEETCAERTTIVASDKSVASMDASAIAFMKVGHCPSSCSLIAQIIMASLEFFFYFLKLIDNS